MKQIPIGCDHAGFELKQFIINELVKEGYSFKDYGTHSEESIDYPDFGHPVAEHIAHDESLLGIVICGSGNGINMTVNKHSHVRSALCWTNEIAELARQHNNANIIALPARFINKEAALQIVKTFLITAFEGGRHQKRVEKIPCG
jgi:ribose 5-phosphate isomerase B